MNIFNLDGGIVKGLSKLTDCICLSLIFFVCCIPVFTIGTACTALYYTVNKVIRYDRGYFFREYISAFKNNFKQTTLVWLIVLVISLVLGVDLYIVNGYAETGSSLGALGIVFLVLFALLFMWISYLFPYMARFENSIKQSMKNALLIAIAHLPKTILLAVIAALVGLAMYIMPLFIFILPAVYTWIQAFILEGIFRKYMSEEDRKAEEEKIREAKN